MSNCAQSNYLPGGDPEYIRAPNEEHGSHLRRQACSAGRPAVSHGTAGCLHKRSGKKPSKSGRRSAPASAPSRTLTPMPPFCGVPGVPAVRRVRRGPFEATTLPFGPGAPPCVPEVLVLIFSCLDTKTNKLSPAASRSPPKKFTPTKGEAANL